MPKLAVPALDPATIAPVVGSNYPDPLKAAVAGRAKRRLSPALGLSNFGVNLTTLAPGTASSHRHWHTAQDEFIFVVSGEITLVTDAGPQVLGPGMCAGFPKGKADGHQLINRSTAPASYLEVGDRTEPDEGRFTDVDLAAHIDPATGKVVFTHKDGTPY